MLTTRNTASPTAWLVYLCVQCINRVLGSIFCWWRKLQRVAERVSKNVLIDRSITWWSETLNRQYVSSFLRSCPSTPHLSHRQSSLDKGSLTSVLLLVWVLELLPTVLKGLVKTATFSFFKLSFYGDHEQGSPCHFISVPKNKTLF